MKISVKSVGFVFLFTCLCAFNAQARDARYFLSIKSAVKTGLADGRLGNDIGLYFGRQSHPPVNAMLARGIITNKKTAKGNLDDKAACRRVMLSALIQLQERARNEGGNAVINIKSYYKKRTFSSERQYECGSGAVFSGVTLKGDVVRLRH